MILKKKETEEQRLMRCKEQYGCNGNCYNYPDENGNIGTCGAIEICDETRKKEFCATVFASMFIVICAIILSPIFLLMWIVSKFVDWGW